MDGYRLFRRDRLRWEVGVTTYGRERWERMELCLGTAESSWMRVKGQTNMSDIGVGVCYTLPGEQK